MADSCAAVFFAVIELELPAVKSDTTHVAYHPEIFEPYKRLVRVTICGIPRLVPENNTILRCLQFLDMERISNADLCWNAECSNCRTEMIVDGKAKTVMACRTRIEEGMVITELSPTLR